MTAAVSEHAIAAPEDPGHVGRARWRLRRGATLRPDGTSFDVWAPDATSLSLVILSGAASGDHPFAPSSHEAGVWSVHVPGVVADDHYLIRVNDGEPRPDPVSRSQPDGVHGASAVVDHATFAWTDAEWKGVALSDYVLYELHVGTFTPEGTFDAIIPRLPALRALGITGIELMPVAEFPGRRNWGYDGAHLYAPHHAYGGPDGLRRLVDAAHAVGVAVVLDVVYNHVGPEGNYLDTFGPYFTEIYRTPWGRALNYDGPRSDGVRRWAHDNALYWISEFHIDALRLDAVQGIYDFGALSFLEELSDEVHALARQLGRKVQLMAESDLNDPRLVKSPEQGGYGLDAQWADDVHHTIHAALTGERYGYYQDFEGVATIADIYREPFYYARRYSAHRQRTHGRPATGVPRQRFIVAAQNHDQVGNRPNGERLASLVPPDRQRLAAALVLLSPYVPLLFMGEEYGETAPFLYFIDHGDPALIESVKAGRQREYVDLGTLEQQIDPQAPDTFARSRIDWDARDLPDGARLITLYADLLALRREEPSLRPGASEVHAQEGDEWLNVLRIMPMRGDIDDHMRSRRALMCVFNLGPSRREIPVRPEALGRWRLRFSTDAIGYGGSGVTTDVIPDIEPTSDVTDAPRRLLAAATPAATPPRTIVLPPWSAAVYMRTFPDDDFTSTT